MRMLAHRIAPLAVVAVLIAPAAFSQSFPVAPGLSPATQQDVSAADLDGDGIPQNVEFELARHFFPTIWYDSGENTSAPGGNHNHRELNQPGRVVFRVRPHPQLPDHIAISYAILYRVDGGASLGFFTPDEFCHKGDAEPFAISLKPDPSCPLGYRIESIATWAHEGTSGEIHGVRYLDSCSWGFSNAPVTKTDAILASRNKHGNYLSKDDCSTGLAGFDKCNYDWTNSDVNSWVALNIGEAATGFRLDLTPLGFSDRTDQLFCGNPLSPADLDSLCLIQESCPPPVLKNFTDKFLAPVSFRAPPPNHPMDFGYYFVDGKYGDYRSEVNCYTNLYYALPVDNYFSDANWPPLFQASMANAVAEGRRIHLNLNWDRLGGNVGQVLNVAAPFWSSVVRIEMQDEPGWSRSQTEQNVGALRSMLAARGLAARPIGNVYTRNQIINDDAPSANGLDWVGIEAYLDPPGSPDPAQNTEALRFYLNAAKARVPSSKNIVLVMMAYDRNGNWTNMQTLVELQYDTYTLAAASDPRVIAITMFSYGRQGGTHDHPELKVPHREIAKALFGPPPDTCPPPPPPPPGPPNPPTDLRADAQQFRVTLTWRDNSNNETEFRIQRMDNNSGSFNPIGSASANSTAFADNVPAVPSGRSATYSYRVKAVNSAGSSGFTNTVTVTLFGDLPGTLTLIAPTGCISSVRPTFSWNAAARSSNYYIAVTRNDVENFFINQPGLLGTSYPYPASTAALTAGVQYRWKVKACNNLGCGAWTPSTLFTPFCPPDPPALTAPVGCSSSRRPTFTWNAVPGASNYYIAVTRVDVENFFINAPGVSGTSYAYPTTLGDLSPGVQYRWKVKSCNNGACGAWSPSSVFTVCPPDPPSLTSPVGCISDVRPTFTWSASPRATNYSIAVTRVDIENFFINTSGVTTTSYRYPGSLSNLLSGVQYRWKVKACNSDGCGVWTASIVFTPNCRR